MQDTLNQIAHDTFVRSVGLDGTARKLQERGEIEAAHQATYAANAMHRIAERIAALTGASLGQVLDLQEANDPIIES